VFPVIYSTLSIEAIVSRLLPNYGITFPVACQFWHRGLSDIYLIETAERPYILRISHHHWRTRDEVCFELEWLRFLCDRHLPVASPLPTKEGKLSIEIDAPEGMRYAALFNYAAGRIPLGDLNFSQGQILGATLAKIHQIAPDFQSNYQRQELTLEYLLEDSLKTIAPYMQHRRRDFFFLVEVAENIERQLENFPKKPPFWSICWGDPHSGNVHFTEDDRLTLFDFDQCGYGWRIFDIAKFLQVSLRAGMSQKVRQAFIGGYQSKQELTSAELSALRSFTAIAHIWNWAISLQNSLIHNYSCLDDGYFTQRLEQLKRFLTKDWQLF
jgi:Ser/Thr protein kinase RdoA (MazF antagonist)